MKGLLMMLKAFGLSDEDIEKIRIFAPQVPTVAQNVITGVNKAIKGMEDRQLALEKNQEYLRKQIIGDMQEMRKMHTEMLAFMAQYKVEWLKQYALVINKLEGVHESVRSGELQRTNTASGDPNGVAHSGADSAYSGAGAITSDSIRSGGRKRGNR
jgi:hypothetical protein